VIAAMASGGGLSAFVNMPSIMIVLGGTIGAVLINYPLADILGVSKIAKNVFFQKELKTDTTIKTLVEMSRIARRDGILALENKLEDIKDPFFTKGVMLMIDGV